MSAIFIVNTASTILCFNNCYSASLFPSWNLTHISIICLSSLYPASRAFCRVTDCMGHWPFVSINMSLSFIIVLCFIICFLLWHSSSGSCTMLQMLVVCVSKLKSTIIRYANVQCIVYLYLNMWILIWIMRVYYLQFEFITSTLFIDILQIKLLNNNASWLNSSHTNIPSNIASNIVWCWHLLVIFDTGPCISSINK